MPKNKKILWTQEETNLLVLLYKQEFTYDKMLLYFKHRSKAALIVKIQKLKVKRSCYKTVNVFNRTNLVDC